MTVPTRSRRPASFAALTAAVLLAGGLSSASTASSALPDSTAVYRATSVSGATMTSLSYTVTAGTITTVTPRLRGTNLLLKTVTAAFGDDVAVVCTAGVLTVIDELTGLGEADYTCTGFTENADRPRRLAITVA